MISRCANNTRLIYPVDSILFFEIMLLFIFQFPFTVSAQPLVSTNYFEVQLQVTQTNYYPSIQKGTNGIISKYRAQKTCSWTAQCVVGLNKWLIVSDFSRAKFSYYYDGSNVCQTDEPLNLDTPHTNNLSKLLLKSFPKLVFYSSSNYIRANHLTITPGEHPLDNFGVNLPWLAFCSGRYLCLTNRLIPLTGAEIRHLTGAFGFRDETSTFEDNLALPKDVKLFASVKLLEKAVSHESLLRGLRTSSEIRKTLKPEVNWPDNFFAGHYQVLDHTNLNGWSIPTLFSYQQFVPGTKTNKEPWLSLSVCGSITSLRAIDEPLSIVSIKERYGVVDYRFRNERKLVDEIHYAMSNSMVKPVTDPALQAQYRLVLASAPIDPVIKARFGMQGFFAFLTLGPALIIFVKWLRNNKHKHKQ